MWFGISEGCPYRLRKAGFKHQKRVVCQILKPVWDQASPEITHWCNICIPFLMGCVVAQPYMHHWVNKNSTVQTVWPTFNRYGLHFYFFPGRINQKHIQFSIFLIRNHSCEFENERRQKEMHVKERRKESQNFNKPWRDTVWILKCS